MIAVARPAVDEYAPAFADYVGRVGDDEDILAVLSGQLDEVLAQLARVSEARGGYRYAPGKWSIKEVIGHVTDAERVFCYRALSFARGDKNPLPSFDEQAWAPAGKFDARPLADLAAELDAVRRATIALFSGLPHDALARRGVASDNEVSVKSLAWIIAGHERHHVAILRERYLV